MVLSLVLVPVFGRALRSFAIRLGIGNRYKALRRRRRSAQARLLTQITKRLRLSLRRFRQRINQLFLRFLSSLSFSFISWKVFIS
ncbi:hypothetical protein V8C26DRAFT_11872 [Trichoderma gracile]